MTKDDIIAFRSVAWHKNFTRAAKELFIPQPSLSKKIANLEDEIGVLLFERSKRSVKLTNAGRVFYQESEALLSHQDEMLENIHLAAKNTKHYLQIAFMGSSLARKFLPHINKFQATYTDYTLNFNFMDFIDIYAALKNKQIDIAITGDLGLLTLDNIHIQKIFTAHNYLILPENHIWLKNRRRKFFDLRNENFILLNKNVAPKGYEKVLEICAGFGFSPHVIRNCNNTDEIFFHIQAHQGISILPNFDCPPVDLFNFVYIPIKDNEQTFPIVAAWNKSNRNPDIILFKSIITAPLGPQSQQSMSQ